MKDIAIITIYNNQKLYNQMKETIKNTSSSELSYEFIGIDNRNNKYSSAALAFNEALSKKPNAKILIFCHQDLLFYEDVLSKIKDLCLKDDNILIGAAGIKNQKDAHVISKCTDKNNSFIIPDNDLEEVFSLDEFLIAGNKKLFERLKFNEELCDGWHLYTSELCLRCHINNIKCAVFSGEIKHLSPGKVDKNFYRTLNKIAKKYHKSFKTIRTTCAFYYTNFFLRNLQTIKYLIKCSIVK